MKRFLWKTKRRYLDGYEYRIRRSFRPIDSTYEFILQRRTSTSWANGAWEHVASTTTFSTADEWSDELGLVINHRPDRIRKPLT